MTVNQKRVRAINDREILAGDYVLYWMQQSQRAEHNPALDLAIREANRLKRPVIVAFGLTDACPEANLANTIAPGLNSRCMAKSAIWPPAD